jgi:hypothetical protein
MMGRRREEKECCGEGKGRRDTDVPEFLLYFSM